MKLSRLILWLVSSVFWLSSGIEAADQVVNFRLIYPLIQFSDPTYQVRRHNYAGAEFAYEWYPISRLGIATGPIFWAAPYKFNPNSPETAYLAQVGWNVGPIFRPAPDNWFDPAIQGFAGIHYAYGGAGFARRWIFPTGTKLSLNLYRSTGDYDDFISALSVTGGAAYASHQVPKLKPWQIDIGLGFRGSF